MELFSRCISASVLVGIILLIRRFGLYRLPKGTFVALWWTVLVKLLVPVSLPSVFSVYNAVELLMRRFFHKSHIVIAETTTSSVDHLPIMLSEVKKAIADPNAVFLSWKWIWFFGAGIVLIYFLLAYLKYRMEFRFALPYENTVAEEFLRTHRLYRTVKIKVSDRIRSPLTYGLFHPIILLPKGAVEYSDGQLSFVLEHEYRHIRRFDGLLKGLLILTVSVYWFLPTVWIMYFAANRDIELWCDEQVLHGRKELRTGYALSLLALEEKKRRTFPAFNGYSKNGVEERIKAIMKAKKYSASAFFAAMLLVTGVFAVFSTTSVVEANNIPMAVDKVSPVVTDDSATESEDIMILFESEMLSEELAYYEKQIPVLVGSGDVTEKAALENLESLKALLSGELVDWADREPLMHQEEENLYSIFLNDGSGDYYYHFTVNVQNDF